MTHRSQMSRRAFSTGLALGLPFALTGNRLLAQTPNSLIAVTPEDLYQTLERTPFEIRYEGFQFEPTPWKDFDKSPYDPGVGGVTIRLADNGGDMVPFLGAYGVYPDAGAAKAAMVAGKKVLEKDTSEVLPKTIEGYKAEVVVYSTDEEHTLTLALVENVLVIGYDTAFRGHHGRGRNHGDHHGDFQSIGHAAVLIKHLRKILDRQT